MRDDFLIEEMKAALRTMDDQPADEWFAEMEAAGILDAKGNVLRRMPEPPEDQKANGAAPGRAPSRKRKPSSSAQRPRKKGAGKRPSTP